MTNCIERANTLNTLIANIQALDILKHESTPEAYLEACCDALNALTVHAMGDSSVQDTFVRHQDWYSTMSLMFQEAGIEILGSGYFSMAVRFKAISGKVIKIGFKKEDSGAAFAAWCRDRKGFNVSEVNFMKRYERVYMVVMPEYQSYKDVLKDPNVHANDKAFLKMCFQMAEDYIEDGWLYEDKSIEEIAFRAAKRCCDSFDEMDAMRLTMGTRRVSLDELKDQCHAIRAFFKDIASFDIHDENVMVKWECGQAHLVVTDPVSWSRN